MVQIDIDYLGDLNCKITHTPSGQTFFTDAPVDNQGKAEYISPTDLTAASIGSCILTIMGIRARNAGFNIDGTKISVIKNMDNEPFRHISKIDIKIYLVKEYDEKEMAILRNVVKTCPVSRSLSDIVTIEHTFFFNDNEI